MKDKEIRIHPTQKPVALYEWILGRFLPGGGTVLDTHVGSASSLIACHRLGMRYVGFEIDADYYATASKRMEHETAQMTLFNMFTSEDK